MNVKQQMINILRDSQTRRIRFSFTGSGGTTVTIQPAIFETVAAALSSGDIDVVEGRFTTDTAMYSARADAATNSAANTFYLGANPRYSRTFNALIIHESVHAWYDLQKRTVPWLDNETAAYIAQAYYLRNGGYPRSGLNYGSEPSIAYLWIEETLSSGDPQFFLDALRSSLNTNSQYQSYIQGTFVGDG